MAQFDIAEAKARFSELIERTLTGDEVVVARDDKPLVKLVPLGNAVARKPGSARGQIRMSKDFDKPLDDFEKYC